MEGEGEGGKAALQRKNKETKASKGKRLQRSTGSCDLLADSKFKALLQELRKMREKDESSKALVFSQYAGFGIRVCDCVTMTLVSLCYAGSLGLWIG